RLYFAEPHRSSFRMTVIAGTCSLSLHDALPICGVYDPAQARIEAESVQKIQEKYNDAEGQKKPSETVEDFKSRALLIKEERADLDRKSTRLNSSHHISSYAVICFKKKNMMLPPR